MIVPKDETTSVSAFQFDLPCAHMSLKSVGSLLAIDVLCQRSAVVQVSTAG